MSDKINFCKILNCKLFVTQSTDPTIIQMYKEKLGCKGIGIPSGGLDEELFFPGPLRERRKIDIGFRAFDEPFYFGHQERRKFMDAARVESRKLKLTTDFSMDTEDRYTGLDWGDFLRNCKSTIGSSSGFDYFELNDKLRKEVNEYCNSRSHVTFQEVERNIFSKKQNKAKMRLISGRIIEAAGTKTTLVLLEDDYSGYLKPNIHYIPVKKDFSDIATAFEKLNDETFCNEITNNAYEVAVTQLTFKNHVKKLKSALQEL